MPEELAEGGGLLQTGVLAVIQDKASAVAAKIDKSVTAMTNSFVNFKKKAKGAVTNLLTAPFRMAGKAIGFLTNKFVILAGLVGGFLAFRKMKQQISDIFEEAVKLEQQLVRLANITGSERFAEQTLGWAKQFAKDLRVPREELFNIAEGLAQIGINASEIDPSGIIAAGQAAGGVSQVVQALQQAAMDPSSILQLQQTFRQLPFERLQEIIRTTQPGDFQTRIQMLNTLFMETFGDNLDRSRKSVIGLRQGLRELITQFRETLVGVGSPLFEFFRDNLEKAVKFIERNERTIKEIGASISQILTAALKSVLKFADFVLERFGLNLDKITESGESFRKRFLFPATAEIIGMIVKLELFAEAAFTKIAEIIDKFKDKEARDKILTIAGVGGVLLGLLLRRPSLIIGGLGLLMINHKLTGDDTVNQEADVLNFTNIMDTVLSSVGSMTEDQLSDLVLAAGIVLLATPLAPLGAGLIAGATADKFLRFIGLDARLEKNRARAEARSDLGMFEEFEEERARNRQISMLANAGRIAEASALAGDSQVGQLIIGRAVGRGVTGFEAAPPSSIPPILINVTSGDPATERALQNATFEAMLDIQRTQDVRTGEGG